MPGDFTQCLIESFFRDGKMGLKTPFWDLGAWLWRMSAWTISRSVLGLPRLGRCDVGYDDLPFDLLPSARRANDIRPSVVEMHPGVAAWLWCRGERPGNVSWEYKRDPVVLAEMWESIGGVAGGDARQRGELAFTTKGDVDAFVDGIGGQEDTSIRGSRRTPVSVRECATDELETTVRTWMSTSRVGRVGASWAATAAQGCR